MVMVTETYLLINKLCIHSSAIVPFQNWRNLVFNCR